MDFSETSPGYSIILFVCFPHVLMQERDSFSLSFKPNYITIQFSSVAQLCPTLCYPMVCSTPGPLFITNSQSLPELMSTESVMPSNHFILCRPLLLLSIFPSIRVFSNESVLCIRWPKYRSFSLSISASNEDSGLVSFRMDWLDLLAVQGTLKSLLQHRSSKASVLWCSCYHYIKKFNDPFFWPCCATCGISVPWPGFEPRLWQWKRY